MDLPKITANNTKHAWKLIKSDFNISEKHFGLRISPFAAPILAQTSGFLKICKYWYLIKIPPCIEYFFEVVTLRKYD